MSDNRKGFMNRWRERLFGNRGAPVPGAAPLEDASPPAGSGAPVRGSGTPPRPAARVAADADLSNNQDRERVVRVFISSTFKDMIADRDELMAQTWPALRSLCRGLSVEFVEVDLRWGITEEQSQRKETVQYCLDEIKRCRPYFIGLLGERYGWVPEAEAFPDGLLEREGWLTPEIAQRSATELEILHGVLNNPEMAGRAFFYFRDPAYAERLATEGQIKLTEHPDPKEVEKFGAAEAAHRAEERRAKLADLKVRIRALCQERGMPLRDADRYADPERLAALVLEDLTAAIEAEYPADRVPDAFAREASDHEAYAQSRRSPYYIGRDAYFERLDAYAREGADGCGLTVLGESGGGKSALLANWLGHWRQAHPDAFVFQHYIGSSPMSAGHLFLMRRLMVAIVRWCAEPGPSTGFGSEEERIPAQSDEILKVFPEYLGRLAYQAKQKGVPALIVLDALNQIEDRERGRLLAWLPDRMPLDLRLVVSTLPGETLEALGPREWQSLTVEPLGAAERAELIARYLSHHSRGLSQARTRAIAEAPACANPLYLKTLLDDLRATGVNRLLDAQIGEYLQASDIPSLLVKVLARYERDYDRDRPGLVKDALSLIWAARRGLTEPELLAVMRPEDKPQLPAAYWTPVRNALAESVVDRGGVLAFAHEHLRRAVEQLYLPDQDSQNAPRLNLADWFEAQPISARSCDELPWLLEQTELYERLRQCLLDIERFLLIRERDQNELIGYWVRLGKERSMGEPYLDSFARWERTTWSSASQARIPHVANALGYFLGTAGLHAGAEPLFQRALEGHERALGPAHPDTLTSLNNLAFMLQAKGDLAGAEPLFRRALEGRERALGPAHPATLGSINNLAGLLKAKGDLAGAELLYRRALEGHERALGPAHPDTLRSLNNLAALLVAKGDLAGAEPLYRRALEGRERALGPAHPDTLLSLNNLALLLQDKGDLAGAELLYRRALEGRERALGPAHPDTLRSLNNLALLLQAKGDLAGAEPLFQRALEGYERTLGPAYPDTLMSLNDLAGLLHDKGDLAGAEPLCRRALEGRERALGPAHPSTLTSLNNLAVLLRAKGDLAGAEPLYRRALEGSERALGPAHPDTLRSLNNLAGLLKAKGDLAGAEPLFRRALEGHERALGPAHPDTLLSLNNLASLLYAKGDLAGAEPLFRRSLSGLIDISRATQAPHPNLQAAVGNYAGVLKQLGLGTQEIVGRLSELAPDFFSGRDATRSEPSGQSMTPQQARGIALELYKQGDYANAQTLLEQLLSHGFELPGTHCHLARIALVTGDTRGAADHAAQAWAHRADAPPYVLPRILWLQLAARLRAPADSPDAGPDPAVLIGRLETALAVEGVQMEWTMDPVLDRLKAELSPEDHALLAALVAALSFPDKVADLDAFSAWRGAAAQPPDGLGGDHQAGPRR